MYKLYSAVEHCDIDWLWYPYIPYGKITLLQGDPGEGKSTFMINLAARLSSGGALPDGTPVHEPQTVIYQCAEDNVNDTVKPRLIRAGADCSKIAFISEEQDTIYLNDARIEDTVRELGAKLLILDPIQSFIPMDTDMQSAAKMRSLMHGLSDMAERNRCAVVLIGHLTKSSGTKSLYRGLGSIDIAAIARSVLMVTRDKKMPEIRYLSQIKSSLAAEGSAFSFVIDEDAGLQWLGKSRYAAGGIDEMFVTAGNMTKLARAQEMLKRMLSGEDVPSKEVILRLSRLGISERTVRSAVKKMNVRAYRKQNVWYWTITEKTEGQS